MPEHTIADEAAGIDQDGEQVADCGWNMAPRIIRPQETWGDGDQQKQRRARRLSRKWPPPGNQPAKGHGRRPDAMGGMGSFGGLVLDAILRVTPV